MRGEATRSAIVMGAGKYHRERGKSDEQHGPHAFGPPWQENKSKAECERRTEVIVKKDERKLEVRTGMYQALTTNGVPQKGQARAHQQRAGRHDGVRTTASLLNTKGSGRKPCMLRVPNYGTRHVSKIMNPPRRSIITSTQGKVDLDLQIDLFSFRTIDKTYRKL